MILRAGRTVLRRVPGRPFVLTYASASAQAPSTIVVRVGDEVVEHVYVGPYSPHTWWSGNPLLTEAQYPARDVSVTIDIEGDCVMRLEASLERVK